MIRAAAAIRVDPYERAVVLETFTAIKRAGRMSSSTYHAKEAAQWLN
jgi:delta-aminolevulinic acid dehydratase/porphobilinogen synthase